MEETNTTPTSSLHSQWPGAFRVVGPARETMKRIWTTMLLLVLVTAVLSFLLNLLTNNNHPGYMNYSSMATYNWTNGWTSNGITEVISFIVSALISCAEIVTLLAGLRGKKIDFSSAFKLGFPMWGRMLLLNLLVGISVIGGLILLVVPGIWIALRLSLAQYYLVDRQMGVMDAYKASWNDTKGELGKIWGVIGVIILMVLPSLTIIGIIATVYLLFMFWPAMAMLYMYISSRPQAKSASSTAPAAA
jgi:hypothetical protein